MEENRQRIVRGVSFNIWSGIFQTFVRIHGRIKERCWHFSAEMSKENWDFCCCCYTAERVKTMKWLFLHQNMQSITAEVVEGWIWSLSWFMAVCHCHQWTVSVEQVKSKKLLLPVFSQNGKWLSFECVLIRLPQVLVCFRVHRFAFVIREIPFCLLQPCDGNVWGGGVFSTWSCWLLAKRRVVLQLAYKLLRVKFRLW